MNGLLMKKYRIWTAAGRTTKRLLHPRSWYRTFKLATTPRDRRNRDDLQLGLYGKVLPSGFLHYAYFEETDRPLASLCIQDVMDGQTLYAEKLMELIPRGRILDVGCGLGGMVNLLRQRGDEVIAVTPDGPQASYVRQKYPGVEVHECKFQRLRIPEYEGTFDAVLNSESLQYIPLPKAAELVNGYLKPGGSWVIADYFKLTSETAGSGHPWPAFEQVLEQYGYQLTANRDITPNILVSLNATHGLATDVGRPMIEFMMHKLKLKRPALHFMLEDIFEEMWRTIDINLDDIEPSKFAATRKYVMVSALKPVSVGVENKTERTTAIPVM